MKIHLLKIAKKNRNLFIRIVRKGQTPSIVTLQDKVLKQIEAAGQSQSY